MMPSVEFVSCLRMELLQRPRVRRYAWPLGKYSATKSGLSRVYNSRRVVRRMGANMCAGDRSGGRPEPGSSLDGALGSGQSVNARGRLQAWLNDYSEITMEAVLLQARSKFPTIDDVLYARGIHDQANLLYIFELMVVGTHAGGKDRALWEFFQEHRDALESTIDFEELAHIAALSGEVQYFRSIFKNIRDPGVIRSVLECAISNEHTDIAKDILSKHEIDLNAMLPETGVTYLHIACVYSNINIVKMLLAKGAKGNVRSVRGDTPLDVARRVFDTRKSIESSETMQQKQHKVYENIMLKEHAAGKIVEMLENQQVPFETVDSNVDATTQASPPEGPRDHFDEQTGPAETSPEENEVGADGPPANEEETNRAPLIEPPTESDETVSAEENETANESTQAAISSYDALA